MATAADVLSRPGMTDAEIASEMARLGVTAQQIADYSGIDPSVVQQRFSAAQNVNTGTTNLGLSNTNLSATNTAVPAGFSQSQGNLYSWLLANPGASDLDMANKIKELGLSAQDVSTVTGGNITPQDVNLRYFQATGSGISPLAGTTPMTGTQEQYLKDALSRAQQLYMQSQGPQLYGGQMYVSPSQQTLSALQQQEALATGGSQALQGAQQAYQQALGGLGATAGGSFLQGSPFQQAAINAATRPITQQFENQVLPGISSMFSKAGRYGSGAMERATGQATEAYGRALGDVSSQMANQQYLAERQLQQQAQTGLGGLAQYGGQMFGQQVLPSQLLSQVGAQQEAIAGQPLQENIYRFNYQQQQPYNMLSGYLGAIYGQPMQQQSSGNTALQTVGSLLNIAGAANKAFPTSWGNVDNFLSGIFK